MVNRADIDAVMILERTWHGWQPLLAACDAGKAVYWAGDPQFDPIADAAIRKAVDDSGIAFMAELPRRFMPATLRLKELIATRLGPPRLMFCHRRLPVAMISRYDMRHRSAGRKSPRFDRTDRLVPVCRREKSIDRDIAGSSSPYGIDIVPRSPMSGITNASACVFHRPQVSLK